MGVIFSYFIRKPKCHSCGKIILDAEFKELCFTCYFESMDVSNKLLEFDDLHEWGVIGVNSSLEMPSTPKSNTRLLPLRPPKLDLENIPIR